jgi:glycogen synthase
MRVLLVADFYPPDPGGLEAHVQRLARALVAGGHEVAVAAVGAGPDGGGPPVADQADGVRLERLPLSLGRLPLYQSSARPFHPPWPDPAFAGRLAELGASFRPDVVHAHGWCAFSALGARPAGVPLVVTLHDYGLCCPKKTLLRGGAECAKGRGPRCLSCPGTEQGVAKRAGLGLALTATAGRLGRGAARFLAVSRHVADRHVQAGLDPGRIQVVPNFLDLPDAAAVEPGEPGEPGGSSVLYVGPDSPHKGRSVLLDAHRRLPAGLARLVLVGGGDEGVAAGVEHAGRLEGAALWHRYQAASVVVVPSVWPEPCPTVALEAMGWARPLVASRTGGLPDLVADGETGLLVRPGDPEALAGALRQLLEDDGRRDAMARAAGVRARSFSTGAVVPRIEAVYHEMVADARAAGASVP